MSPVADAALPSFDPAALADVPDQLLNDPSVLVRERAVRAARVLMAEHGLDISMEQIAEKAGVGRRTLFRHFVSRDALVGAALASAFVGYERWLQGALESDGPLETLLVRLFERIHRSHQRAGRGLWQLACAFDDQLPPEFEEANRRRREMRKRITLRFADHFWISAGGQGPTPVTVVEACSLLLSSFTTHSMVIDLGLTTRSVAVAGARLLTAIIKAELPVARPA